MVVALS
jgi:hypothetical protein